MTQRKILVLGSDYGTLRVVKEAHQLGLYVIVADLMETSPTKLEADEAWLISTTDIETLYVRCMEYNVTAIMFGASDFNIENARKLCRLLNLPIYCDNDDAWKLARDKGAFKALCKSVGVPVAPGYEITSDLTKEQIYSTKFPVVVKPVDKSGNRGMSYCDNEEELIKAFEQARLVSDNNIIVERRLVGAEYNVHYVVANGEARLLYFSSTHHEPGCAENLYSFKCTTSKHLKQYLEEVNDSVISFIKASKCKEGIVWFDCMRDQDGKFYLLEMGYRFGGVMTYVPYERVTGFNTIKWMLECSLGVKHSTENLPEALSGALTGCAASYHLFATKSGTISKVKGLEHLETLSNVYIDMPKRAGNDVRENACMGLIGIYAKDVTELCDTLRVINATLSVVDDKGDNMFIYYDDYDSITKEYYEGLMEFAQE